MLDFAVPLRWSDGAPYAPGAVPVSWLGEDGTERTPDAPSSGPPPGALRLRFRTNPSIRDNMRIERLMDELAGGVRASVQLEVQIATHRAAMVARYEQQLWPDGRPDAETPEAAAQQQAAVDRLYALDLVDRFILERLEHQHRLVRVMAEWEALVDNPPAGWGVIATKELPEAYQMALVRAYIHHRDAAAEAAGKALRSGL